MRNLFKRLPSFPADYSGACNAARQLGCLTILHGQGGCIGGVCSYDDFEKAEHDSRILFTKISEIDTVTGNDEKLLSQIEQANEIMPSDFLLICGSPIPMLIGTDWEAWTKTLEEKLAKPVIALNTKGFATYEEGEKALFMALVQKFAKEKDELAEKRKKGKRVNIIGDTNLNGWISEMRETYRKYLQREFSEVIFWNKDAQISQIEDIALSDCNIAVSASAIPVMKLLKERFGTPYRIGFPVGADENERLKIHGRNPKKILLVGEQVAMGEIRHCLRKEFALSDVKIATFFAFEKECMEPGDVKLDGEDDLENLLAKDGPYDYILGDKELRKFGGFKEKFITYPQIAVSGCELITEVPAITGKAGYAFLKREIEEEK